MTVSRNQDNRRLLEDRRTINRLHQAALGYLPLRMKPVHFATSFLMCLHRRYRKLELLNKTSNPKAAEKVRGDEYVADNLYARLISEEEAILDQSISLENFKTLRNHLQAVFNNDGSALGPAFAPYSTFGCDYSTPSLEYLANQSKNRGNSGAFAWLVLNSSEAGREFLEIARRISLTAQGPAATLGAPFLKEEEIEYSEDTSVLCGNPTIRQLSFAAKSTTLQTQALLRLARNLEARPSSNALRNLIIGLGSWLLLYQILRIPGAEETIFFSDFAGETKPRIRAQAKACYARQLGLFGRSLRLWLDSSNGSATDEEKAAFERGESSVSKELEDHFRDFSERIGWAQPRSGAKHKFFRAVPDTLRVLVLSILEQGEVLTMDDVAERLFIHWRLAFGLVQRDHGLLRQHGYTPLDEDADLRANREAFKDLAVRLGFAWEPSDGLVLFSVNQE